MKTPHHPVPRVCSNSNMIQEAEGESKALLSPSISWIMLLTS